MTLHPTRRRFTVAEYYQMAKAGIFTEDDRVELINGEIIEMTPIGDRHAASVTRLHYLLQHFYASGHPGPGDVLLLIEVADTSSRYDRRVKVPLYGISGIPECWLVDLEQETVTVYRDPTPNGYRTIQTLRRGERLSVSTLPDLRLAVDDILG